MSDSNDSISMNTTVLDALIRTLRDDKTVAKVGIIGNAEQATIGACHEFGTTVLPVRSFLRMPVNTRLPEYLAKSGQSYEDAVRDAARTGNLKALMTKVSNVALAVIAEAFATGGFGQWVPSNMKDKTNAQTLVETGQLRDSITAEVS